MTFPLVASQQAGMWGAIANVQLATHLDLELSPGDRSASAARIAHNPRVFGCVRFRVGPAQGGYAAGSCGSSRSTYCTEGRRHADRVCDCVRSISRKPRVVARSRSRGLRSHRPKAPWKDGSFPGHGRPDAPRFKAGTSQWSARPTGHSGASSIIAPRKS